MGVASKHAAEEYGSDDVILHHILVFRFSLFFLFLFFLFLFLFAVAAKVFKAFVFALESMEVANVKLNYEGLPPSPSPSPSPR